MCLKLVLKAAGCEMEQLVWQLVPGVRSPANENARSPNFVGG